MPAEFERMVDAIKSSLRKEHPDWVEKRVSSMAYAFATARWHKMGKSLK